ncbi:MAG TPA: hypothetical protein DEG92_02650 [Rikenellaceae bacterium]|nr:hypothetical protein [Rikenellaceae bacterium]
MNTTISPWEAVANSVVNISFSDIGWIIIGITFSFIFYSIAIKRPFKNGATWKTAMFWLICIIGWGFVMFMVVLKYITPGDIIAKLTLILTIILVASIIVILTKKTKVWEQIISGSIIALVGFGVLAAFGTNNQPIGYALITGMIGGAIIGQFSSSAIAVYQSTFNSSIEIQEQLELQNRENEKPLFHKWMKIPRRI